MLVLYGHVTRLGKRVGVILDGLWHNVTGSHMSKSCLARTQPYMGRSAISFSEIWGEGVGPLAEWSRDQGGYEVRAVVL